MRAGIYEIRHIESGKRYVGSSVDVHARWRDHRKLLNSARHHSPRLQRAWTKYGAEAFQFRQLLVCRPVRDELLMYEGIAFRALDPFYNIARVPGSRLGIPHPPEVRARISAAAKAPRPGRRGKRSEEEKAKRRLTPLGGWKLKPWSAERRAREMAMRSSPEFRAKLSASLIGNKNGLGFVHSAEARAKISAARRGHERLRKTGEKSC